jgi:hypothetical protein
VFRVFEDEVQCNQTRFDIVQLVLPPCSQILPFDRPVELPGKEVVHAAPSPKRAIILILLMSRIPRPVLVSITDCAGPLVNTNWVGNVRLVGENIIAGRTPAPLSGSICGLPDALSAMETAAFRLSGAVGLKVTVMEQLWPGGTGAPQLSFSAKSPLLDPVILPRLRWRASPAADSRAHPNRPLSGPLLPNFPFVKFVLNSHTVNATMYRLADTSGLFPRLGKQRSRLGSQGHFQGRDEPDRVPKIYKTRQHYRVPAEVLEIRSFRKTSSRSVLEQMQNPHL